MLVIKGGGVSLKKIREQISQLKGVLAVNLSLDDGGIDEIHVVSNGERSAKRIVRDIETIVQVETGKVFDHKKISVAEVNEKDQDLQWNRVKILGVFLRTDEPLCNVEVEYKDDKFYYKYEGDRLDEPGEIVLKALIKTVESLIKPPFRIKLMDFKEVQMREHTVVVHIRLKWDLKNGRGEEDLVGCSLVENNLPLALSKAFFHALNRRLNTILAV